MPCAKQTQIFFAQLFEVTNTRNEKSAKGSSSGLDPLANRPYEIKYAYISVNMYIQYISVLVALMPILLTCIVVVVVERKLQIDVVAQFACVRAS